MPCGKFVVSAPNDGRRATAGLVHGRIDDARIGTAFRRRARRDIGDQRNPVAAEFVDVEVIGAGSVVHHADAVTHALARVGGLGDRLDRLGGAGLVDVVDPLDPLGPLERHVQREAIRLPGRRGTGRVIARAERDRRTLEVAARVGEEAHRVQAAQRGRAGRHDEALAAVGGRVIAQPERPRALRRHVGGVEEVGAVGVLWSDHNLSRRLRLDVARTGVLTEAARDSGVGVDTTQPVATRVPEVATVGGLEPHPVERRGDPGNESVAGGRMRGEAGHRHGRTRGEYQDRDPGDWTAQRRR